MGLLIETVRVHDYNAGLHDSRQAGIVQRAVDESSHLDPQARAKWEWCGLLKPQCPPTPSNIPLNSSQPVQSTGH